MTVLGLGELARAVCLPFEVFLAACSPPCSPLLNNGNQPILVSFTEGMNKCRTHLLWPLLSAHPPTPHPSTPQRVDTYLYLKCIRPFRLKKLAFLRFCLAGKSGMQRLFSCESFKRYVHAWNLYPLWTQFWFKKKNPCLQIEGSIFIRTDLLIRCPWTC